MQIREQHGARARRRASAPALSCTLRRAQQKDTKICRGDQQARENHARAPAAMTAPNFKKLPEIPGVGTKTPSTFCLGALSVAREHSARCPLVHLVHRSLLFKTMCSDLLEAATTSCAAAGGGTGAQEYTDTSILSIHRIHRIHSILRVSSIIHRYSCFICCLRWHV